VQHGCTQPVDLRKRAYERCVDSRDNDLPPTAGTKTVADGIRAGAGGKRLSTLDESILVGQGIEARILHAPSVNARAPTGYLSSGGCGSQHVGFPLPVDASRTGKAALDCVGDRPAVGTAGDLRRQLFHDGTHVAHRRRAGLGHGGIDQCGHLVIGERLG
jgi:hypothetical protein